MRELVWMVDEVNTDRWDRAADLMALTANIHRSKRSRAYGRRDFHPYAKAKPQKSISVSALHELKSFLPVQVVTMPQGNGDISKETP